MLFVYSHLSNYADFSWSRTNKTDLEELLSQQERAVKKKKKKNML